MQFNTSFATQAYRNGNYFSDKKLARLVALYDSLSDNGYKQLLLGTKSRAPIRRPRGPAHPSRLMNTMMSPVMPDG